MNLLPLQFLALTFAGCVNPSQQDVIEYLQAKRLGRKPCSALRPYRRAA